MYFRVCTFGFIIECILSLISTTWFRVNYSPTGIHRIGNCFYIFIALYFHNSNNMSYFLYFRKVFYWITQTIFLFFNYFPSPSRLTNISKRTERQTYPASTTRDRISDCTNLLWGLHSRRGSREPYCVYL